MGSKLCRPVLDAGEVVRYRKTSRFANFLNLVIVKPGALNAIQKEFYSLSKAQNLRGKIEKGDFLFDSFRRRCIFLDVQSLSWHG